MGISLVMINEQQLRSLIGQFVTGSRDFEEIEDEFVSRTWNIAKWGDGTSQFLTYRTELYLAENQKGALTNEELRTKLHMLVNTFPQIAVISTASTTSLRPERWSAAGCVGKIHATASELPTPR
jgi:hypothetical protein